MWAVRAAITGRTCGADMVGILDILGKEVSLYRAKKAVKQTVAQRKVGKIRAFFAKMDGEPINQTTLTPRKAVVTKLQRLANQ